MIQEPLVCFSPYRAITALREQEMVRKSKQLWLTNADGSRFYRAIPYNGCERVESLQAAMVAA